MKLAASEHRNATVSATSSGRPIRPSGCAYPKEASISRPLSTTPSHDVGVDHAGQHGVGANSLGAAFDRQYSGDLRPRGLGRGIGGLGGESDDGGDRCDRDDRAAVAGLEPTEPFDGRFHCGAREFRIGDVADERGHVVRVAGLEFPHGRAEIGDDQSCARKGPSRRCSTRGDWCGGRRCRRARGPSRRVGRAVPVARRSLGSEPHGHRHRSLRGAVVGTPQRAPWR